MRIQVLMAVLAALCFATPGYAETRLEPGIWTNTEDAYFAEEEGREQSEWMGFEIGEHGNWRRIDDLGQPKGGSGWQVDGSEIRRARPFNCWVSTRKFAAKPDGSADWTFANGLSLFDQGGRVFVSGKGDAPDVTIRLRNVTWAKDSRNKPSLVLYVHKDDPERAESYSWASPDASMVGINLRWVQGSCSRVEKESQP